MKSFLVITITCPDRPGIVEQVTDVVVAHGGNWEESRLARLGGDFAGIVMVSVAPEREAELTEALAGLAGDQMNVLVKPTSSGPAPAAEGHPLYRLRLEGADHEGIVHDVAASESFDPLRQTSPTWITGSAPRSNPSASGSLTSTRRRPGRPTGGWSC